MQEDNVSTAESTAFDCNYSIEEAFLRKNYTQKKSAFY